MSKAPKKAVEPRTPTRGALMPASISRHEGRRLLAASSARATPTRRLQALGRLRPGTMNNTEAAYAAHLEVLKHSGAVLWFHFEGIKLRLADNTFLTVDFAVLPASGVLEMVDVKGSAAIFTDDARVKMKVAAEAYPFVFKVAYPLKKRDGGGWREEAI